MVLNEIEAMLERKVQRFEFETGVSMLQYGYNFPIFGNNPVGRLLQQMHSVWKFPSRN